MAPLLARLIAIGATVTASVKVEWTQTARNGDGSLVLLQDMPPLTMEPVADAPKGPAVSVDTSKTFQVGCTHQRPLK
jgi:hypothetical protein